MTSGTSAGNKATFTVDAYAKRNFEGTVSQVRQSPQTVQNVVTYDIVISVDNSDLTLMPGMTAASQIVVDQRNDVIRVPNQALRYVAKVPAGATQSGQAQIWLLRDGKPAPIPVVAGLDDDNFTEIASGEVKQGDLVITAEKLTTTSKTVTPRLGLCPRRIPVRRSSMPDPIIRVVNVTRTYHVGDVDVHALRGVSLTVEPGEFIAIMGSSGSGKSTLMSLLGCLDRPSSGEYYLEGVNVAGLTEPELARIRSERLGFVFQSFNLLARTSAIENVALPLFYAAGGASSGAERTERARASLHCSVWPTGSVIHRGSCPGASSSASPSRGP